MMTKPSRAVSVTAQLASCPIISGLKLLPNMTPRTVTMTARSRSETVISRPAIDAAVVANRAPIIQARGRSKLSAIAPPTAPIESATAIERYRLVILSATALPAPGYRSSARRSASCSASGELK